MEIGDRDAAMAEMAGDAPVVDALAEAPTQAAAVDLGAERVTWLIVRDSWRRSMIVNGGIAAVGLGVTAITWLTSSGTYLVMWGAILYGAARFLNARSKHAVACRAIARIESQLAATGAVVPPAA
jgi:hypothetical protein